MEAERAATEQMLEAPEHTGSGGATTLPEAQANTGHAGMRLPLVRSALLVVDVQQAFSIMDQAGRKRNNPGAADAIAHLLGVFRRTGKTIIHVRHANTADDSLFNPANAGFEPQPVARERPRETVMIKRTNSAFIHTDLDAQLTSAGIGTLIVVGATTNHCVESTVRMSGNLGYSTYLVSDATWTYDIRTRLGRLIEAAEIHSMSLANLEGEFCRVVTSETIAEMFPSLRGG